ICTCTGVVSGKASMSRRTIDTAPKAAAATAARMTAKRWRSERSMIQFSTSTTPFGGRRGNRHSPTGLLFVAPSPLAQAAPEQFGPQRGAALHRDQFAGQDACDDLRMAVVLGAEPDGAGVEDFWRAVLEEVFVPHEDDVTIALPLDRPIGDDDGLGLLPEDH